MLKKYLTIAAMLGVSVVVALGLKFLYSINYGMFTVFNDSHEELSGVVTVCRQDFDIPNLAPGDRYKARYKIAGDSSYVVRIRFKSGKELWKDVGYVTNGMEFNDELHVTDKDVAIVCRH